MTKKVYRVDLDYENYLFDTQYNQNHPSNIKITQSFEYAFFLVNKEDCLLFNSKNYSQKYLNHLKNLGFMVPKFTHDSIGAINFWGVRKNKELEKKVNSKITSAKIALEHGIGMFNGIITSKIEEVTEHLDQNPTIDKWLIKKPHSFSGIGHYFFSRAELKMDILEKILVEEVILEPVYERVFDIGTTYIVSNGEIKDHFMVENFNSSNGRFKGAMAASSTEKFKGEIFNKYKYDLSTLEEITRDVAKIYLDLNVESNIQIDSFIYKENGILKLYPLVEVNCRKTMGLVAQSLADKYPHNLYIEWKILNHKETEIEIQNNKDFKNWIEVSPEDAHFKSFFKCF